MEGEEAEKLVSLEAEEPDDTQQKPPAHHRSSHKQLKSSQHQPPSSSLITNIPSTAVLQNSVQKTSAPPLSTSNQLPAAPVSPVHSSTRGFLFSTTSGETSQNSTNCSVVGKVPESGENTQPRLMYINERFGSSRPASSANLLASHGSNKASKSRKMQRDLPPPHITTSSTNLLHSSTSTLNTNHYSPNVGNLSFSNRALKHHSFVSDVPDVRHMEQALLGLLDDFHSGKLRAFGSGCTMEQMTDIREQQERLARLHFELGAHSRVMMMSEGQDNEEMTAQENMTKLVQKLEQLSVSIERLHSTNSDL